MNKKITKKIQLNRGKKRLLSLILTTAIAIILVIYLPSYFIEENKITDFAAIATIVGGVFTVLGVIFTAWYKEISSYYKDKSESAQKRWALVLPMIKEQYMFWITAASSLANSFQKVETGNPTESQLKRILFLLIIFYGIRLRNLQKNGGFILLSNPKDEDVINQKYKIIKDKLDWAEEETPNLANGLAELFVKNEREGSPYAHSQFEHDIQNEEIVKTCLAKLKNWLTPERAKSAKDALLDFENTFRQNINKLSSTWDD